jgi:23S rRNA (guanosine2251-2'-O)-methyltransferase
MQIEGRNPVLEALNAKSPIKKILLNQEADRDSKILQIIEMAGEQHIELKYKSKRFLDKIASTKIHQGVIAFREDRSDISLEEIIGKLETTNTQPFFIFIREAQNEYNVGSIIRSAEIVGAQAVILPPKTLLSPQMVRASMGASEYLEIINVNLFQAIKTCQENNIKVIGIEVTGEKYYYEADLKGPVMFIIGGEDRSLSEEIKNKCDFFVKIPMQGKVNSLNMSIAASIVMFEKLKQQLN